MFINIINLDLKPFEVADEAFFNAVQSYYEVFIRSPRIGRMVESGGATAADFRDVFKNNIDKRIKNLPEIDGLRKGFEKSIRGFF